MGKFESQWIHVVLLYDATKEKGDPNEREIDRTMERKNIL